MNVSTRSQGHLIRPKTLLLFLGLLNLILAITLFLFASLQSSITRTMTYSRYRKLQTQGIVTLDRSATLNGQPLPSTQPFTDADFVTDYLLQGFDDHRGPVHLAAGFFFLNFLLLLCLAEQVSRKSPSTAAP